MDYRICVKTDGGNFIYPPVRTAATINKEHRKKYVFVHELKRNDEVLLSIFAGLHRDASKRTTITKEYVTTAKVVEDPVEIYIPENNEGKKNEGCSISNTNIVGFRYNAQDERRNVLDRYGRGIEKSEELTYSLKKRWNF